MRRPLSPLVAVLAAVALTVAGCDSGGGAKPIEPEPVGDWTPGTGTVTFNVSTGDCDDPADRRTFRKVGESRRAIIYAEANNPLPTFSDEDYKTIALDFDRVVWPVDTRTFGEPVDVDGNKKVSILYTRAVNELTSAGSPSYIGGFFYGRDLFPRNGGVFGGVNFGDGRCSSSNQGELFYMLAPDPNGVVNGNARSYDLVRRVTVGTLAHEFQHLINASRRIFVNDADDFEASWLDEGIAHVAEELVFLDQAGLTAKQNIDLTTIRAGGTRLDAFNGYATGNFARLREHLRSGEGDSPIDRDDDVGTRGAAWQFLRYAIDRKGTDETAFWRGLVNAKTSGFANLQANLGADPLPYLRDWSVAVFTDDAVAGVPAAYTFPTWNYRDVLPALYGNEAFPLKTTALTAGATVTSAVNAGGAAYYRLGVAAGTSAAARLTSGGTGPSAACGAGATDVALAAGGVVTLPAGPQALCLPGGTTGADYALVAFHASTAQATSPDGPAVTLPVEVTASGVVAPALVSRGLAGGPAGLRLSATPDGLTPDTEFHARLRFRERAELSALLPGGWFRSAPRLSRSAAPADLVVTVVRTR